MSWNIALAAGAALTTFLGAGQLAQEPSFDFSLAIPQASPTGGIAPTLASWDFSQGGGVGIAPIQTGQGFGSSGVAGGVAPTAAIGVGNPFGQQQLSEEDARLVSVSFHGAKFGEVLKWMEMQGANFIIKDSEIKDDAITMNLTNVPMNDVLNAVASAMGGYWQRHGKIRVFSRGEGGFTYGLVTTPAIQAPRAPAFAVTPFAGYPRTNFSMGDFKPLLRGQNQFGSPAVRNQDWKGFLRSLTRAQKDLLKKQGYLKVSDLTDRQRSMIGIPKQTFEMVYKEGNESVKIKSD